MKKFLFLLCVFFCFVSSLHAASRVAHEDFTSGELNDFYEAGYGNSTVTYPTGCGWDSSQCARLEYMNATSSEYGRLIYSGLSDTYTDEYFIRMGIMMEYDWTSGNGGAKTIHFKDTVSSWGIEVLFTVEGGATGYNSPRMIVYSPGDQSMESLGITWTTDTWHEIEMYVYEHATAGIVKVWDDGVLTSTTTGIDTEGANPINYLFLPNNWSGTCPSDDFIQVDDIEIYVDGNGGEAATGLMSDGTIMVGSNNTTGFVAQGVTIR